MDERAHKVPLFEGKDFGLWKRRVLIALRSKKALIAIETSGTEEGSKKPTETQEDEAQNVLFNSLGSEVAKKVLACETAADIWKRMLQIYEKSDEDNVDQLLECYYAYKKEDRDDMSTHVGKVERMASQLEAVGQAQTDESVMSKLLTSLPQTYVALKEAWRSVHPDHKNKDNLIARLLKYDASENGQTAQKDVALVAKQRDETQGNGQKKKKWKCFNCNKMGTHYARDCRSAPQRDSKDGQKGPSLAMTVGKGRSVDCWVVDSGASRHISCRRDWFSTFEVCSEQLQVGNEQFVKATGCGTIKIECLVGTKRTEVTLQDVLYIPEMSYNLFSTGRAARTSGAKVLLDDKGCRIVHNGETVATGTVDPTNSITTLNAKTVPGIAMLVSTSRTLTEWHQTLGHVDPVVIQEMVANNCVEGLEIVEPQKNGCEACPAGKGTRAPHTTEASIVAVKVGDVVDLDLIGPINELSLGGRRYILLARDRYSGYSHIGILASKDEVSKKLQDYVGTFEAESGARIKCIYTDNGSEFANTKVSTLCSVEHIKIVFSAPYTPEQNGGAERNNRTILNTARTMLVAKGLPTGLWAEAAMTAVYIRNRVSKRGRKQTPYETFIGRKPFIGHLVPFGTPVQSLVNDRRLGKFESKTESGYVVGFTQRTNTYRIYIPEGNKVKVSSDVIFRGHLNADVMSQETQPKNEVIVSFETREQTCRPVDAYFDELQANNGRLDIMATPNTSTAPDVVEDLGLGEDC